MPDFVQQHFAKHPSDYTRPAIRCADGCVYSVQASSGHWSIPRSNDGPWTHVEVWARRRDGRWLTTEPEAYVDINVVNRRIARHGGPVA